MGGALQDGEKPGTVPGLSGPAFLSTAVCGGGVLTLALVGALVLGHGDPVAGQEDGIVVRSPLTIVADGNRAPSLGTTPAGTARTPAGAGPAGAHQVSDLQRGQGGQGRSGGAGAAVRNRVSEPTRPAPQAGPAAGSAAGGGSTPQYVPPPNGATATGSGVPVPSTPVPSAPVPSTPVAPTPSTSDPIRTPAARPHRSVGAGAAHPCPGPPVTAPGPGAYRRGAGQSERGNRTARVSPAVCRPGSARTSHPGSGAHPWRGRSARPAEARTGRTHQWSRDHHQQRDITTGSYRHSH